jgi:hypothetical protein
MTDAVDRWVSHDGGTVTFSGKTTGGRPFSIVTYLDDANEWINGGLIQNCFPYLSADEREILMTGIDSQSWDEMFAGSEDDE